MKLSMNSGLTPSCTRQERPLPKFQTSHWVVPTGQTALQKPALFHLTLFNLPPCFKHTHIWVLFLISSVRHFHLHHGRQGINYSRSHSTHPSHLSTLPTKWRWSGSFANFSIIGIVEQVIHVESCRMLSSIPSLSPLDTNSTPLQVVTTKKISRYCQTEVLWGKQNHSRWTSVRQYSVFTLPWFGKCNSQLSHVVQTMSIFPFLHNPLFSPQLRKVLLIPLLCFLYIITRRMSPSFTPLMKVSPTKEWGKGEQHQKLFSNFSR